ncbi:hypothetical protein [Streptomyces scopuliridis]|uniref:Lipoprotein n=1 Tax=Streptomyces scopuliridis RB72 TaxID=1440053 RepID=A0A2T7TDT6_9ACTN|nr:hypothetical protein [Streptomyces scopuliridis]PVE13272.1 hypothetical protein Y717_20390 [Streptomyces scopuliridis RB72]
MRQLSAPGRFAVWIVTSLAVAASTGCMSVGEDEGKPAPSRSAEDQGAAAEPDGLTGEGAGAGEPHAWQGRTEDGGEERAGADGRGKEGRDGKGYGKGTDEPGDMGGTGGNGASPSASSAVTPSPEPSKGTRPQPGEPVPPGDGHVPPKEPTRPAPPASPPPGPPGPDPEPQPEPEPTKPPEQPSASPAADVRTGAMSAADGTGMRKEPMASPQLGPV